MQRHGFLLDAEAGVSSAACPHHLRVPGARTCLRHHGRRAADCLRQVRSQGHHHHSPCQAEREVRRHSPRRRARPQGSERGRSHRRLHGKDLEEHKGLPGTYGKGDAPKVLPVGKGAVIPALDRAVHGQQAGSRVLVVAPPTAAYGTTGNARLDVSATETVVFVVDVVKVLAADLSSPGPSARSPRTCPR
ncbi:FKBP-type peptidyl-prolyl cis-trans isomerase [Streptomyces sp. NPDC058678]|uniref:FKBP-type peptidyl-prolyl cis-trans isomerase n=1 Tax=Streptomyces sp. NPDC058678 TaxID=3346595 RepID=UPI003653255B